MIEYFSGYKWNYQYVLMCVDHFSKYSWGALINNKEAQTIVEQLEIVFSQFGFPTILQHDNGKEFDNELLKNYCNNNGIKQIKSSIRHPQSQGAVEKLNHFLNQSLATSLKIPKKK